MSSKWCGYGKIYLDNIHIMRTWKEAVEERMFAHE